MFGGEGPGGTAVEIQEMLQYFSMSIIRASIIGIIQKLSVFAACACYSGTNTAYK